MMSEQEAFAVAPLALAYLGDAVWELQMVAKKHLTSISGAFLLMHVIFLL
ncbi:hypothetical protein [Ferroacidibacillus organovorans]|nr:hypothetical protein [Ferroacidibacillus organovorans]